MIRPILNFHCATSFRLGNARSICISHSGREHQDINPYHDRSIAAVEGLVASRLSCASSHSMMSQRSLSFNPTNIGNFERFRAGMLT